MQSIDINLIEQRARALRAQEIQRVSGVCAERMALYFQLMGRSLGSLLATLSELLRPLFSWIPPQHHAG